MQTQPSFFNESLVLARRFYLGKKYSACLKLLQQASELRPTDENLQRRIIEVEQLTHRN
jgi:hypothetical protein